MRHMFQIIMKPIKESGVHWNGVKAHDSIVPKEQFQNRHTFLRFRTQKIKFKLRITYPRLRLPLCTLVYPFLRGGIDYPCALCDTSFSVSIIPKVIVDHLSLQIEPYEESFTFVDYFKRNSEGIVRNLEVQIGIAFKNSSLLLGRAFMATVGAVCNMQTNQLYLTLIDPNVYDRVIVVKPHMSSLEIGDYPGFIAVCYSDSRAERKSDGESSIDTQPERSFENRFEATIDKNLETSIDSWADEDHRESFVNSTATHTKRKICVVQLAEYGVYTDEDGNAQTMDGKIINVSKEEIEAILEMDDKSGGKYLSLPQYEGPGRL
ncbi:hypothetical protein DY000_02031593 [Brassica cretica]|uniref:DUF223 domain-containing protein n=1 Tax=Brassica cretica TaxID=69181 RepID=A0ABQ7DUX4_BRACR|nr:hypothetical protein DY000_02031593 [Brassica cretica]